MVNAAVKHSASQNSRYSVKDSTPLGSVPPPPKPLKAKGKEDLKQTPVVFMTPLISEQEFKFIRLQTVKRDRCKGASCCTLSSLKKGESRKTCGI